MSTPSDRALKAVKASGLDESPMTSLERDDALFVLTNGTLVYQDGGGTRRVTLRDLTRIHSDQEGMLRVETPAGTALTASLLGFDPGDVQAFFGQVRNVTAQAKSLPSSPLPSPAGGKTFSAAPEVKPEVKSAPAEVSATELKPVGAPTPPDAPEPIVLGEETVPGGSTPPVKDVNEVLPPKAAPTPSAKEPLVITASGSSPSSTRAASPAERPVAETVEKKPEPVKAPEVRVQTAEKAMPVPLEAAAPIVAAPLVTAPAVWAGTSALAADAAAVAGLVSRLRLLGGVLFVAALALAYFQFSGDQRLNALWTLLAGGVGSIALLALADMARLLVSLARASGGPDAG